VIDISAFGETLRTQRERQGFDLETVAEETKIRKHYINALEIEDFDVLPPRVYATGFVTTYARFLKLDPEAMVSQFKSLAYHDKTAPAPVMAEKRTKREFKIPIKNIIAAAMFLLIALWAGNWVSAYIAQQGASHPPTVQEPAVVNNPPANDNPSLEPAAPEKLALAIVARQRCWLLVKVDGIEQFSGFIEAGESKAFEAAGSIIVKAGNAGGIDLTLNNQPLAPLGNVGQVVEKHFEKGSIAKE